MVDRRVDVLIAVPALIGEGVDDPLRELAVKTYQGLAHPGEGLSFIDFRKNLLLPSIFHADPTFGVLPGGSAKRGEFVEEKMDPEKTEVFILAGYIEIESDAPVPETLETDRRDIITVMLDLELSAHLTCGNSRYVGKVKGYVDAVKDLWDALDLKTLRESGLDGSNVAIALVDTGIQLAYLRKKLNDEQYSSYPHAGKPPVIINVDEARSWQPRTLASQPFKHCLDHGTMTAYDLLICAPAATLLDYPMLSARSPGDHLVKGTIRAAMIAYHHIVVHWIRYATYGLPKPPYNTLVINNSWGIYNPALDEFPKGSPSRYVDNPNHPFRSVIKLLEAHYFDIIFCSGNCGAPCPTPPCLKCTTGTINGAGAYPEVLTVAGCDLKDDRVGYSSQGPAIAGMPQPKKPDVSAYTHFLGSGYRGRWLPDAGTSVSAPVTAGCIAALRTKIDSTTAGQAPADLFDTFRSTAVSRPGPAGWNADYGFGIINPVAVGTHYAVI
jgi:subtilisin family serine protease